MWRSKDNLQGLVFLTLWVLGIELSLSVWWQLLLPAETFHWPLCIFLIVESSEEGEEQEEDDGEDEEDDDDDEDGEEDNQKRYYLRQRKATVYYQAPLESKYCSDLSGER